MYRARAEAVSGTRVYADGKWLRCIGNKNVSVGEYVWTDGRCVYGHLLESEQSKVITAQEDEGIPIVSEKSLYTFEIGKNRLKHVAEIKEENDVMNVYNVVGDELKFAYTLPNTDKWTDFTLMINDDKKTAWLYDYGTHYRENRIVSDTELITSNIDKHGNRFDMVVRYKNGVTTYTNHGETSTFEDIYASSVDILKNGEVVQSVDLQAIVKEAVEALPDTDQTWATIWEKNPPTPIPDVYWEFYPSSYGAGGSCSLETAFIEDSQTWYFFLVVFASKYTGYVDDPPIEGIHGAIYMLPGLNQINTEQYYFVTGTKKEIVSELTGRSYPDDIEASTLHNFTTDFTIRHAPEITVPLQDGFSCKFYDIFTIPEYFGETPRYYGERRYSYVTLYSPRGKELFSGITLLPSVFPICRVRGKYLVSIDADALFAGLHGETPDTYNGVRVFRSGLYLISVDKWEKIGKAVKNERLRPMKKFRGWQKRLQLIEFEQHEI